MNLQLPATTYVPPQVRKTRVISGHNPRTAAIRAVSSPISSTFTRGVLQASNMPRSRNVSSGSTASTLVALEALDSASPTSPVQLLASETAQASQPVTPPCGLSSVGGGPSQCQTPTRSSTIQHAVHGDAQDCRLPPIQAPSPRVRVLTALDSPLRLSNGTAVDPQKLLPMAEELESARNEGRFPTTTTSYMEAQAVMDDFEQLQALEGLVRGSQQHNELYVENVRRIRERDSIVHHETHDAHVRRTVDSLLRNQDVGEDLHALIRQAARNASANAVERVLARHDQQAQQALHGTVVREVSQAVIRAMAEQGVVGAHTISNVDNILEEVFGVIEARVLDATGPLRLNVNNLRNIVKNHDTTLGNHMNNLTTQLSAMNNHVSAVGNHVNALGAFMQALNANVNLTNNQMGQFGNEINSLQQIANMLPTLVQQVVQQSVQQILPGAIKTTLIQALSGAVHAGNGKESGIPAPTATATATLGEKFNCVNGAQKIRKRKLLARFFRRSQKNGRNQDASLNMVH